ncbi:MAG: hypothetical protein V4736_10175 [Bdellovibrionota bacterium]
MNFKSLFRSLFLTSLLAFTSCDRFVNDNPPASEDVVELEVQNMKCLNDVAPTLKEVFKGNVVEKDVDASFQCLNDAMIEFRDKTTDEVYTSESIVKFFNSHLLTENHIEQAFEDQLLKVKQVFLGGDGKTLTRTELNKLLVIFKVLGQELKKVGPHLPLLLQQKEVTAATQAQITRAVTTAHTSIAAMYDKMEIESTDYNLSNASDFLKELAKFLKGDDLITQLNTFRDLIPFVQACLDSFYGPTRESISVAEVKRRTAAIIKGYGYYLEYHFQLDKNQMTTAPQMDQWLSFLDRVLNFIESDSNLSSRGFAYDDLKVVLVEMNKRKWMPWEITPDSLDKTAKVIFGKIGNPNHAMVSDKLISIAQWRNIRWEYSQWRIAQLLFSKAPFDPRSKQVAMPVLLKWMANAPIDALLTKEKWSPAQRVGLKASWAELQSLMKQRRPIKFNEPGGIMLVDEKTLNSYTQTWTDTLRFNVFRSFNRLLFLGYSDQKNLNLYSAQITEQGLIDWYDDFKPLAIELRFFDPRSGNSGSRSFLEASHFTAYSDGSKGVDYNEGFQYVSYLFSAGLVNADRMYDIMKAKGCALKEIDVLGNPFLTDACFKQNFRKNFRQIFANLPKQADYVEKMTDAQWNDYYNVLLDAARTEFTEMNAGIKVETSDVRTIATLSHYVESLFTQFDLNQDGLLSDEEIKAGSPRFLPFLRNLRPGVPDLLLKEGFIAMVINGKMPSVPELLASVWEGMTGNRQAARIQLLKVISALKTGL